MPTSSAPAAAAGGAPPPAPRGGLVGRRFGRLVERVAGRAREHRDAGSAPTTERPGVPVERLLLRPGGVLGVVLSWPYAEDDPGAEAELSIRPAEGSAERPEERSAERSVGRIALSRWSSVGREPAGSDNGGGRWTGSGTVEVGAGVWRLTVSIGGRESDLLCPDANVTRARSLGPDDLTLSVGPGPERQALLRVEPSAPTAVVRRVRARRAPLEVDVVLPRGWSISTTRFELKERRGPGAVLCPVRPTMGGTDAGADAGADAGVDAGRYGTVSIGPDGLHPAEAGKTDGSSVWDLWVASTAGRLRVGRRDTDLKSLRTAHSWGWSDHTADLAHRDAAQLRPYFTDSCDFAVEVRPVPADRERDHQPDHDDHHDDDDDDHDDHHDDRAVGAA